MIVLMFACAARTAFMIVAAVENQSIADVWYSGAGIVFLCAVTLLLTIFRKAHIRSDRARRYACIHCGYDVLVSKDRCPECGRPIG